MNTKCPTRVTTLIRDYAFSWLGRMFCIQFNSKLTITLLKISRTHLDMHPRNKIKGYNVLSKAPAHTREAITREILIWKL